RGSPTHGYPVSPYDLALTPPSPPYIYTLSLHDALPISYACRRSSSLRHGPRSARDRVDPFRIVGRLDHLATFDDHAHVFGRANRSEEHTSELQSRGHLVCRLLLEKKRRQR